MKRLVYAFLLALGIALTAKGQGAAGGNDPFGQYLYPPELVMGHQQEIGLQENQRSAIQAEIQKAQTKFLDLQWKLNGEGEKMGKLLGGVSVDETKVLDQVDRILNLEREIKKTQVSLLVRLKNALSGDQQAKLAAIRGKIPN